MLLCSIHKHSIWRLVLLLVFTILNYSTWRCLESFGWIWPSWDKVITEDSSHLTYYYYYSLISRYSVPLNIFKIKQCKALVFSLRFIPCHATTLAWFWESLYNICETQWSTPLLSCVWPPVSICHSVLPIHPLLCSPRQFGSQPEGSVMTVLYCGRK